ncbi:MAG: hypothetical protein ACYTEQ_29555 [Planctomycetota bacterium]|jgi:hypothetical protein
MIKAREEYYIEDYRAVAIKTLEEKSGRSIEEWIADWNDENEPVKIERHNRRFCPKISIWIGDCDYVPGKYKCPACGRWNFELLFMDPTGSMFVCKYCGIDGEF